MATGVPPLGRKNYQWWARTYGTRGPPHGARVHEAAREVAWSGDRERTLFDAIRANRVAQIERWIADSPAIAVTKVFTRTKQTALHVASFFGRHEIVRLLLEHGADRNLATEGVRPVDVAGMGRSDAVDRMKVRALLTGDGEVDVLIEAASSQEPLRLHIHFSEPVSALAGDDVATHGCRVVRLSRLRADMYAVFVELDAPPSSSSSSSPSMSEPVPQLDDHGSSRPFVQIPAGAAVSAAAGGSHRAATRASAPFFLSTAVAASQPPRRPRLEGPTGSEAGH